MVIVRWLEEIERNNWNIKKKWLIMTHYDSLLKINKWCHKVLAEEEREFNTLVEGKY